MAGNDNYIGLAMGLDVTDLKTGLTETKKEITTARKEFNATTAGMDDWTKSSEGLNAKLKELDTTIKNQEKAVAGYEAELERAKEQYGENSEQVRKLNNGLLDAQTALGKSQKAQRKYTQALADLESESEDAEEATESLTRALKNADKATDTLKGGFSVLKGAMANLVATGITSLVSGLQNVVSESREFRKEMAFLEAGADAMGVSFEDAEKNVAKVTSITEDQGAAVEGLNNLMTAGFDGDALDKITDELVGASIKWKDTLKFEGLSDGLQETLAIGEATGSFGEMLERSGMDLEKFNEGLAKNKTEAEKQNYVLETLSKLGLSDITDGYVKSNKALVDGAKANYDYEKAMAKVGEKAEPVLNSVKKGFVDVLSSMMDTGDGMSSADIGGKITEAFQWFIDTCVPVIKTALIWLIDNFKLVATTVGAVGSAFVAWKVVTIINDTVKTVKGLVTAMKNLNLETIKNTANWVKNTAVMVAHKTATVASTVATKAMTTAQKLLNLAMKANPIGIVITAITLLVTAFVVLWKKSDAFRNFWIGLWDKIKKVADTVWKAITKFFTGAWDKIKKTWSSAGKWFKGIWDSIKKAFSSVVTFYKNLFSKAWDGIKSAWNGASKFFSGIWSKIKGAFSNVVSFFKDTFSKAWDGIKSAFNKIGSFFGGIVDDIVGFFKNLPDKMADIGKDMMNGLIKGVKNMIGKVKEAVTGAVDSAIGGVKKFLNIDSPSKLMRDEIGKMMGLGVAEGITDSTRTVVKDAQAFASKVSGGLTSSMNGINAGLTTVNGGIGKAVGGTVITNNYNQVINAPKQPSRLELYRQSKNLLGLKGVY